MSAISRSPDDVVSVVLPVRDCIRYLPLAMDSLLSQTYREIEILAVDDGSVDGSREYLDGLKDSRVRVLDSGRHGVVAALNLGLSEARGRLVARQDADDFSLPERIERQVAYLHRHPHVAVLAACAQFVDGNDRPVESDWTRRVREEHDAACTPLQVRELLPLTCCLVHGSVMARKEVLLDAGGYRSEFEWAEDYDLWLRLLSRHRFAKLPERLYGYRIHGAQASGLRRGEQIRSTIRAKLSYLRELLPRSDVLRAIVQGTGIGAGYYREHLAEFGILDGSCKTLSRDPLPCTLSGASDVDLLIVTDFHRLDEFTQALTADRKRDWIREGNFFVRELWDKAGDFRGSTSSLLFKRTF